jgi:hypothetical protein
MSDSKVSNVNGSVPTVAAESTLIEFKRLAPATPLDAYYWIAINGASCAAMLRTPLSVDVQCSPTPEVMFGFPTRDEAQDTQHFCLTRPIADVELKLSELQWREDVVIKVFKKPQPPTHGPTLWIDGPSA